MHGANAKLLAVRVWPSLTSLGLLAWLGADGAVDRPAPPDSATVAAGRTTALVASMAVGQPVERAIASRAFAQAVGQDRKLHWAEAATLYQQTVAEWSAEMRVHPTVALERAIQKAERERQRSTMLANLDQPRARQPESTNRPMTVERARLLRTKLMVVRANSGAVPDALYTRAREAFEDALKANEGQPAAVRSEIQLLLCATHAATGARHAGRLALAQVPTEQRQEPINALHMAVCEAALGEQAQAMDFLEAYLRQRIDPFTQRELFLANDWDPLRGQPRFENLFATLPRY